MNPLRKPRRVVRRVDPLHSNGGLTRQPITNRRFRPASRPSEGRRGRVGTDSYQLSATARIVAVVIALGVTWICWNILHAHLPKVDSSTIQRALSQASKITKNDNEAPENQKLAASIQSIIAANPNLTIGVSMVNNTTGTALNVGTTTPFVAASTAKVLTAAAFLHTVEQGKNSLTKTVDGYPAKWQLQQMINQSNNDSWSLLERQVGLANLAAYATQNGVGPYSATANTLTPHSMATLLSKLYNGKLLNQDHTKLLLSYMQHTNNEDMIPMAVPGSATVYHKYGELNGYLHDAGIITYHDQSVALVIYTSAADASNYPHRTQVIRQITTAVTTNLAER